jgi:hypothetical protein
LATDKPFYKLAIDHPAAVLKLLGVSDYDDYAASSFTFKATENRRDLILKQRSGKKVLFVEPHGYADPYVYHGLLDGMMMYCRQNNFTGEMRAGVIFLKKSHYVAALKFRHHFDGQAGLAFQPIVLIMDQIKVAELEKLNDVRLIPLYPLCKIASNEIESSLPVWAQRIKHTQPITVAERIDLLTLLGSFATHRVKRLTLERVNKLVGGFMDFTFEDTRIGKELIRIGVRRGVRRGVPQGMHRLLLQQIAYRFGRVPNTVRQQIEKISNAEELERIAKGLFEAKDLKQLKTIIGPNGKSTLPNGSGLNGKRKKEI